MIEFKLHQTFSEKVIILSKRTFCNGNYDGINKFISSVDWISVLTISISKLTGVIYIIYSKLTNIVRESIEKFTPLYEVYKKLHLPKYLRNLYNIKKPLI